MKVMLRKLLTMALALLLTANMFLTAFAAGTVTYEENAKEFVFEPGSSFSPTDLFFELKNIMPGDSIKDQIAIKNDEVNRVKIKVYLRSMGAQEETDEFLSQLNLSVAQSGSSILFDAPADQTAQLTDWVYLGTVYSGGEILLDMTLEAPLDMGNEHQDKIGCIDWQFRVEELPVEPGDPDSPQTGDTSDVLLYAGLMLISFTGMAFLLVVCKAKKEKA